MDPLIGIDDVPIKDTGSRTGSPTMLIVQAISAGVCALLLLVVNGFRSLNGSTRAIADEQVATCSIDHVDDDERTTDSVRADNNIVTNINSEDPKVDYGDNLRRCYRCYSTFSVLFNRRLSCDQCRYFICKQCAIWDSSRTRSWICNFCYNQQTTNSTVLSPYSYDWLHRKLLDRCRQLELINKRSGIGFGCGSSIIRNNNYKHQIPEVDRCDDRDSGYDPALSSATSWDNNLHHQKSYFQDLMCGGFDGITERSVQQCDPAVIEAREAVEVIVQQFIGPLDNVPLEPLYQHSEYDRMVEIYHRKLRDALFQLVISLQLTMHTEVSSKVLRTTTVVDDGEFRNASPSTAHVALKKIITKMIEEAECLPPLHEPDAGYLMTSVGPTKVDTTLDYEDSLATAILNKIIERYQKPNLIFGLRHRNNSFSSSTGAVSYSSKEIQTDNELDTIDDRGVQGTGSGNEDFSWAYGGEQQWRRPLTSYKMEEQIEEVVETTTVLDPFDEAIDEEPSISRTVVVRDVGQPMPFPELNIDIQSIDNDPTITSNNWEENWLFRPKRSISPFSNMGSSLVIGGDGDPIAMFVPNPQEHVKARIGSRDIDELSEMSDVYSDDHCDSTSSNATDDERQPDMKPEIENITKSWPAVLNSESVVPVKTRPEIPIPAPRRSKSPSHPVLPTSAPESSSITIKSIDIIERSKWLSNVSTVNTQLADNKYSGEKIKINCGPKMVNLSRYKRDYYIPNNEKTNGNDVISDRTSGKIQMRDRWSMDSRLRPTPMTEFVTASGTSTVIVNREKSNGDVDDMGIGRSKVLSCAAFWDRRVQDEKSMDDDELLNKFPMTIQ